MRKMKVISWYNNYHLIGVNCGLNRIKWLLITLKNADTAEQLPVKHKRAGLKLNLRFKLVMIKYN